MTSLSQLEGTFEMKIWPIQDAKARFSEFLDTCLRKGRQIVTQRSAKATILPPMDYWRRWERSARLTLKDLLLAGEPRAEFLTPPRGKRRRRAPNAIA
jgi:antitoxin Phd